MTSENAHEILLNEERDKTMYHVLIIGRENRLKDNIQDFTSCYL